MQKLILFDIDGTLVAGGPAKGAFHQSLLEVYGTAGAIETHEFSGKTDPQIARELLSGTGMPSGRIDEGFPALWERYTTELARRLPADPMRILPGVRELIDALVDRSSVALGLLTGNLSRGAELKLGSVGLHDVFAVGGFGSDHEERNDLPDIAIRRARDHWDVDFDPADVVVVGDTPRDIECGRFVGARTVAVATGRFEADRLREAGASRTLADFSETDHTLGALLEWE